MADGFMIEIDADLAQTVRSAAAAQGVAVEAFVREALAAHLLDGLNLSDNRDPAIDEAIAAEAARSGDTMPWESLKPWVESWGQVAEAPPPKWRE
jgi:hypothetical protein